MNKLHIFILAAGFGLVVMPPSVLAASGDEAGSSATVDAWSWPEMPMPLSVAGGQDSIENALLRIVPAPYKISLDRRVPKSVVLVWHAGDNWFRVLSDALLPLGLEATADWANNTIRVVGPNRGISAKADLVKPTGSTVRAAPPTRPIVVPKSAPVVAKVAPVATHVDSEHAVIHAPKAASKVADADTAVALPVRATVKELPTVSLDDSTIAVADIVPVDTVSSASSYDERIGPRFTIRSGQLLSEGLASYIETAGWQLRWTTETDYPVDAAFSIPPMTLNDAMAYVFQTYQSQGGLTHDTYTLAVPNRMVVVHPTSAKEKY